ncbi:hypothetical protein P170DRAFT_405053 [Aspergillus steynii IBT 23096]|uniref:G domain-containing protein n=1 Tax=Aspergillus steynii IBT 23096 TaxID=1392250 RepID=A0A2I2GBE2_9EURO|nr:uncharacterized protein P170DRAFT_405053 [Aspergillus steynii IBT 23096]PLB50200.1 hypothetical protein P170DRAFT_405053 [Aspergillus steynii IBT 23096]
MTSCLGRTVPKSWRSIQIGRQLPRLPRPLPQRLPSRSFSSRPQSFPKLSFHPLPFKQQRLFSSTAPSHTNPSIRTEDILPICCPGCGAYSQTVEPEEAGYYGKTRKQTRKFLSEARKETKEPQSTSEQSKDTTIEGGETTESNAPPLNEELVPKPDQDILVEPVASPKSEISEKPNLLTHICDRCHDLLHHNKAVPAVSPTIYSVREFLKESPYKHNRIYHVIDAADFPMSLVDNIYEALSLQEQRSRNRRASTDKYRGGRKLPTISFIITRSDLLAPTKEQVDSKMDYVRSVLRDALKQQSDDYRLGNVHMISAHRGWWTKNVKEEIAEHGGGVWVVGKANVGKSSFIEACFPKDAKTLEKVAELVERRQAEDFAPKASDFSTLDPDSLLPPAPREDQYPILPVVSSLPGTTVSPIRIPFGRGRGEMIDLPGLERTEIANHVVDSHKRDLIMTKRIKPQRHSIKAGQSLLLGGGLVRITAVNPDHVVMAACFLPIEAHVTRTEKAIEMQAQQRAYPGEKIVEESSGNTIASAGVFDLKWDVTQSHLPISIAKAVEDKGIQAPRMPYRVMSTDILIEGCGWVELTIQVRANAGGNESPGSSPQVEIFSPNGQHIGSRRPIECWRFTAEKQSSDRRKRVSRGRQSIGKTKRTQFSS